MCTLWNIGSHQNELPKFLKREPYGHRVEMIDHTIVDSKIIPITFTADSLAPIRISAYKTIALIDSGSSINCVSRSTLKNAGLRNMRMHEHIKKSFTTASNEPMTCDGRVHLTFSINDVRYSDDFYVFQELSQDIIIGRPFLYNHKAILNFDNKTMQITGGASLITATKVRIKPRESMLIATIPEKRLPTGLHGHIGAHTRRNGLQIRDCLATACNGKIAIAIDNPTAETITIKKGKKIGSFKPLSADQHIITDDVINHIRAGNTPNTGTEAHEYHRAGTNNPTNYRHAPNHEHEYPPRANQNADENQAYLPRPGPSPACVTVKPVSTTRCDEPFAGTSQQETDIREHLYHEYEIDLTNCESDIRPEIARTLYNNRSAFTDSTGKLGYNDWCPQKIELKPGTKPFARQPYRMPPDVREQLRNQIDRLLAQGVLIEQPSVWAAPVVPIKKQPPRARRHMRDANTKPEIRLCVDYRYLNGCTIPQQTHIVNTREIMDDIGRAKPKYFTTLDLNSGFFQQALSPDSQQYTGFLFDKRSFCFKTCPQGLNNSPFAFQRLMHVIMNRVNEPDHVFSYIDDVIIVSHTMEHHIQLLDKVLRAFTEANLTICGRKSKFAQTKVTFLGYDLTDRGVTIPQKHREAILSWPTPRNARAVKSFLGCVNYFRHFIVDRGKLLKPLTDLTKKDQTFHWREEHQQSFDALKQLLGSEPLLRHPDFTKPFIVYSDASSKSIGGALCQLDESGHEFPVAFIGRSLNSAESRWTTTDQEALALVYCVKQWEVYLSGREFKIYTDHKALTHIFKGHARISSKLARYAMFMSEFNYTIHHLKGVRNHVADALSRRMFHESATPADIELSLYPLDVGIKAVTRSQSKKIQAQNQNSVDPPQQAMRADKVTDEPHRPAATNKLPSDNREPVHETHDPETKVDKQDTDMTFPTADQLRRAQTEDTFCNDLRNMILNNELPRDRVRRERCTRRENDFCIKDDGVLYQIWQPLIGREYIKYRALIPESLQKQYIECAHFSNNASHLGTDRLISYLREHVIFKGMYQKCADYVNKCETCRLIKPHTHKTLTSPGLYELTESPWEIIHMDAAGPLPISKLGNRYFTVVVDRTTGFIIAWPSRDLTAESLARNFHTRVTCLFGPPACVITDNAQYYRSKLWAAVANRMGIQLRFVAPYHPQSNGKAESAVKRIKNTLKCMARSNPYNWDLYLPSCVYALNNSLHTSHKLTPQVLIFGKTGRSPLANSLNRSPQRPLFQIIRELEDGRDTALRTALNYHTERRALHSKVKDNTPPDQIVEGSVCYWKLPKTHTQPNQFADKNRGPYMVVKRYKHTALLKHIHSGKIHKLPIHVSQLFTCGKDSNTIV